MTIRFRLTQIALSWLRMREDPGLPPQQVSAWRKLIYPKLSTRDSLSIIANAVS